MFVVISRNTIVSNVDDSANEPLEMSLRSMEWMAEKRSTSAFTLGVSINVASAPISE